MEDSKSSLTSRFFEPFVVINKHHVSLYHVMIALCLVLFVQKLYNTITRNNEIPLFGEKGPFAESRARFTALNKAFYYLRQGYTACAPYKKPFKIRVPGHEIVLLTNPDSIKELGMADESSLSITDALLDVTIHHFLGRDAVLNPYHIRILSKNFAAHLSSLLPGVTNELRTSFEEIAEIGTEWKSIQLSEVIMPVIARTSNYVLVGASHCRDSRYIDLVRGFSSSVFKASFTLDMLPQIFIPILRPFLLDREKVIKQLVELIGPTFVERRNKLEKLGDAWVDRPKDAIQWVLEGAPDKSDLKDMCSRILFFNFAAIDTSTLSMLQVLYDLAAYPEFREPVREEIESILTENGGWCGSKSLNSMKKLDSVIRESLRMNGPVGVTSFRKTKVPFTFVDGTYLPKGTTVATAANSIQNSSLTYENPTKYDGFRFSKIREQPGRENECQITSVSSDFLVFGVGKHACPGRFFLANELKILLAYLICNYEFKLNGDKRPDSILFSLGIVPPPGKMEFRRRKDWRNSYWNKN